MAMIVGIDPGFSGAIVFLNSGNGSLLVRDMPVAPSTRGRTELDLYRLGEILTPPVTLPYISILEKVAARPNQGAASTFRFGQGYGAIEMALAGHMWERYYVTPPVWKKHFGLSKDKGVSRALASQRFPRYADLFARVKDDGRAEAALLALWGQEVVLPKMGLTA